MGKKGLWLWGWLIFCLAASVARAEDVELFKKERFQGGPWRIRAEKVLYDAKTRVYTAEGRVEVVQGERRLTADWAQVNETTKIAHLKGNVVLVVGEDIFTGQEGSFNLVTRGGEMRGARLFLKRNHFHVDSALIRKTGERTFYAEEAVVTTCDADRPAWSFNTKKITVVLEGVAHGKGNTLRLAGLPVFYSPFVALPVVTQRQSGFLLPNVTVNRSSGTVVELPFYWTISNHADATLYQNYLTRRGYMQGMDLRYRGHRDAAGEIRFVYLKDTSGNTPTPNRYWVSGMVDQSVNPTLDIRATFDRVSDADFLQRFNYGYLGLNRFNRDLLANFGRELEQQEVKTRVSTLLASANFPWGNVSAFGRYYQSLLPSDTPRGFLPFNRAPWVRLNTLTFPVGKLPLLVGLDSSYGYFLQNEGGKGHRLDFHPQVWLQTDVFKVLSLEARGGFTETFFLLDKEDPDRSRSKTTSRELYDVKVSLASTWFRDFGRQGANDTEFMRHYLRPEVTYWNMPRYDALRLPYFDPFDWGWVERTSRNLPVREGENPLGGVNSLTYGFSSNLLRRWTNPQGQAVVRDLFWFRFLHGAFFNSSNMGINGFPQPHRRFSDFLGEVEFYPFRWLTVGSEVSVSPYGEGLSRAKVKLIVYDREHQRYLNVSYLNYKDFANQINISTYLNLLPSIKTWLTANHTFLNNNRLEKQYGVILQRQCWGVAITYTDRPDDQRLSFSLIIPSFVEKFKKTPINFPEEGRMVQEH